MVKKIILETILIIITVLVIVCGYYLILDIESIAPETENSNINIESKEFMSRKIFTITPKEKNEKVILYFHGGAYVAEATEKHWTFLEKLANDTKATIIMPDYPLTPKYTYKDVMNMVEPLYKETIEKVGANNLIVMGDSAGGGMALGLLEKLSQNGINMPLKTILISPWLDTNMTNPKIDEVQQYDKDLNKEKLLLAGLSYARGLTKEDDYFVNPINGNLSKLQNVTIFTGTYDILNPDCYVLKQKAKEQGIDIEIKEYATASHVWIINNDDELATNAYNELIKW